MTEFEINQIAKQVAESLTFCSKEVLTLQEAAKYLGVSKSYLYKLTCNRQIAFYKPMGKINYFNRLELEKWLQKNRVSTNEEIEQQALNYCMKGGRL